VKLLVFGGTRGTGLAFIEQALHAGHEIVAFARTPSKITVRDPKLSVVQGDVLDEASIDAVMQPDHVVVVSLGSQLSGADLNVSVGTRNIITVMKKKGPRRIVVLSAWGSGDSAQYGGFMLNKIFRPLFLSHNFAEHELQEDALAASGLDYTVVRPGRLTNAGRKHTLQGSRTPEGLKQSASRADVAAFMLAEASSPKFIGQMILVG